MIFAYFTLAVALLIEVVGAYYSITGLAAIFSGAVVPILIMGGSLEVGKVTAAVWLKNNWHRASTQYKLYLLPAVALLMMITSMGIFGFLSKAHNDQNLVSGDVQAKIAVYDEKIKTARENIEADRKQLRQMDEAVDQVMARSTSETGADKANAIRRSQQRDRVALAKDIEANQKLIASLNDQAAPIRAEVRKVEAEVGPIKYIAKLIYGDNPDANILEKAVVWVIIMIVAVFDPLALVLILAAQQTIRWAREEKWEPESGGDETVDDQISQLDNEIDDTPDPYVADVGEKPTAEELEEIEANSDLANRYADLAGDYNKLEEQNNRILVRNLELTERIKELEAQQPTPVAEEPPEDTVEEPVLITRIAVPESNANLQVTPPPEEEVHYIEGSDHLKYRGQSYSVDSFKAQFPELAVLADNHPSLTAQTNNGFGTVFPTEPNKGDTYLRTDYLPSRLFKWNGQKWLEVDKQTTDVYAYNDKYIEHLVKQVLSGEYELDDLTPAEQEQVEAYLKNNQNTLLG